MSYGYDARGNRTSAGGATYSYNALNQLISDSAGNDCTRHPRNAGRLMELVDGSNTTSDGYDALDELTSAQTPQVMVGYGYDGLGRRSDRLIRPGPRADHYGDLTDLPILTTDGSGSIVSSYVQGPGTQASDQLVEERAGGETVVSGDESSRRHHCNT